MIAVHKHIVITVIVIRKALPIPSTAAIARMTISILLFRSTPDFSCLSTLSTPCSSPFNKESIVTQYKLLDAFKFSLDGVVSPDSHLKTACRNTFIFSANSNCVSPLCFLNKTNFSSNFIYSPSKYITPEQRCPPDPRLKTTRRDVFAISANSSCTHSFGPVFSPILHCDF